MSAAEEKSSALRQLILMCVSDDAGPTTTTTSSSSSTVAATESLAPPRNAAGSDTTKQQLEALGHKGPPKLAVPSRNVPAPPPSIPIAAVRSVVQPELTLLATYRLALLCCPQDAPRDELEHTVVRAAQQCAGSDQHLKASPTTTAGVKVPERAFVDVILSWLVQRGAAGAVLDGDTSERRAVQHMCLMALDTALLASNASTDRLLRALLRHEQGLCELFRMALVGRTARAGSTTAGSTSRVDAIDRVTESEFRSLLKHLDVFPTLASASVVRDTFRFALVSPLFRFEPMTEFGSRHRVKDGDGASRPRSVAFAADERLSPNRLQAGSAEPRALCFICFSEAVMRLAMSLDDTKVEASIAAIAATTGEPPSAADVALAKLQFLLAWINTASVVTRPLFKVAALPPQPTARDAQCNPTAKGSSAAVGPRLLKSPAATSYLAVMNKAPGPAHRHKDPTTATTSREEKSSSLTTGSTPRVKYHTPQGDLTGDPRSMSASPAPSSVTPPRAKTVNPTEDGRPTSDASPAAAAPPPSQPPPLVLWPGIADRMRIRPPLESQVSEQTPNLAAEMLLLRKMMAHALNIDESETGGFEVLLGAIAPVLARHTRHWFSPQPSEAAARHADSTDTVGEICGLLTVRAACGNPQSLPNHARGAAASLTSRGRSSDSRPPSANVSTAAARPSRHHQTPSVLLPQQRPRTALLHADNLYLDSPMALGLGAASPNPPRFCAVAGSVISVFVLYTAAVDIPPSAAPKDAFRDMLSSICTQCYACFPSDSAWRPIDAELMQLEPVVPSKPSSGGGASPPDATAPPRDTEAVTLVSIAVRFRMRLPAWGTLQHSPGGGFTDAGEGSASSGILTKVMLRVALSRRDTVTDIKATKLNPRSVVAIRFLEELKPVPLRFRLFATAGELREFVSSAEMGPTSTTNAIALGAIRSPSLKAAAQFAVFEPVLSVSS